MFLLYNSQPNLTCISQHIHRQTSTLFLPPTTLHRETTCTYGHTQNHYIHTLLNFGMNNKRYEGLELIAIEATIFVDGGGLPVCVTFIG